MARLDQAVGRRHLVEAKHWHHLALPVMVVGSFAESWVGSKAWQYIIDW
jgi:hypothetical protein